MPIDGRGSRSVRTIGTEASVTYDWLTILAAERVVLDRITKTRWAAEARLLSLVAADIRKLGEVTQ
jgi:hypothetical protein